MKTNACAIVGREWPTFSVPGICSSSTIRFSLKIEVVGANEPMPSVSKKFVTKPSAIAPSATKTASFAYSKGAPCYTGGRAALSGGDRLGSS
jgi:hypothetical protein